MTSDTDEVPAYCFCLNLCVPVDIGEDFPLLLFCADHLHLWGEDPPPLWSEREVTSTAVAHLLGCPGGSPPMCVCGAWDRSTLPPPA